MKEEENCIDIEQLKPSDRNNSLRYDHLNLKMIDSVENDDLDESLDIENSKANSTLSDCCFNIERYVLRKINDGTKFPVMLIPSE